MRSDNVYAHRHVPAFQALFEDNTGILDASVQAIKDGTQLTAESLKQGNIDISRPILVEDTPESIGMSVFQPSAVQEGRDEKVRVQDVADVIGHNYPVRVIDVEHQEELNGWTLGDLCDYFEGNESQCASQSDYLSPSNNAPQRAKRKAAEKATNFLISERDRPRILNQISMEFSRTALRKFVVSPQFVRDLDWIGNCWPEELKNDKPSVEYYCLTSSEGCFTDFHCDFGGSSVYYHVLSGTKRFCLIKPTKKNLRIYEDWLLHPDQESIFLPSIIPDPQDVITVTLRTSRTLFIPTGWVHAVYTPENSVVLGGNFLHGSDIPIQLEISEIEQRTRVLTRFRFPHFRKIHFYAAGNYLGQLRDNSQGVSGRELGHLPDMIRALEKWHWEATEINATTNDQTKEVAEAADYSAKHNGCASISDFFAELWKAYELAKKGAGGNGDEKAPNSVSLVKKGLTIQLTDGVTRSRFTNGLGSPKSPKIRLKLKPAHQMSAGEGEKRPIEEKPDAFRIVISSVAKKLHQPLPRMRRNPRTERLKEEVEYVGVDPNDEEWVPSEVSRGKQTTEKAGNKRKGGTATVCPAATGRGVAPRRFHNMGAQGRAPAAKKPKTTARQRLLKKFR